MQQIIVEKEEIKIIGISVRTSNKQEMDKMRGKIFPCVKTYFHEKLFDKILHRKNPGTTFCAYTDYESDYHGDYTYFIGEEILWFPDVLPEGFKKLTVPKQQYAKFTAGPAPMPEVLTNAWQKIWTMSSKELGGERSYKTDFEIYDDRALDHEKIVLDLYIGIKK